MVPEVGIGGQVSVFDDFLDVINEEPLKGYLEYNNIFESFRNFIEQNAHHYQAQVIGDARGSGLSNQNIPRFHGVCLQHFANACDAQSIGDDDKFASVAVAARRSVTTQQQVSLIDKTVSKAEWQGFLTPILVTLTICF